MFHYTWIDEDTRWTRRRDTQKKRATPTPTPTAALLAAKRAWWAWKCNLRREVTAMGVTQDMWLVDFVEDEPFGRGGVLWRCKGYRENAYLYIYINSQVGLEGLQVFVEQVFSLKISLEYWVHVETERKSWLMRRLAERGWLNHIFFLICKASLIPSYNLYQQEKTLIHIDPIGSNLSPALGNTWHANFQSFSLRSDIHFPQSWFSRKWV